MEGIDLNFILNNTNIFKKPIIASGGITSLKDLQTLKKNETKGIEGVICGRAIYEGKIDIIIGTHALLQNSIKFKNLSLIIVDEEQQFGVMH